MTLFSRRRFLLQLLSATRDSARFHATDTLLGLLLLRLAAFGRLTHWLLPVAVSLCLTIPLSWLVQRDAQPGWLLRPLTR